MFKIVSDESPLPPQTDKPWSTFATLSPIAASFKFPSTSNSPIGFGFFTPIKLELKPEFIEFQLYCDKKSNFIPKKFRVHVPALAATSH